MQQWREIKKNVYTKTDTAYNGPNMKDVGFEAGRMESEHKADGGVDGMGSSRRACVYQHSV